ncbi:hypothetical protein CYMTET_33217 [Cymbomonas tetramitiformis]|uniref:Uncharacterized protein n=1 Tax=Cymbomonas tetramitiformis TaxID=36881 RepID=A0AAE0FDK3_9CHLO|nr:hypothetical protein CYMTET_33217 [Cymbomonas tetramitiformis]
MQQPAVGRTLVFLVFLINSALPLAESVPRKLLCRENCAAQDASRKGAFLGLYPPPIPSKPGQIYVSLLRNRAFIEQNPEVQAALQAEYEKYESEQSVYHRRSPEKEGGDGTSSQTVEAEGSPDSGIGAGEVTQQSEQSAGESPPTAVVETLQAPPEAPTPVVISPAAPVTSALETFETPSVEASGAQPSAVSAMNAISSDFLILLFACVLTGGVTHWMTRKDNVVKQ